jgi:predicted AlkP superfamily phosphohydrolase/phosphomutase
LADEHVGFLMAKAGPDTVLAVGADHGQTAVNRVLRPNVALRAAGLLTLDAQGHVDLAHTRAMYFVGNFGYVLINRVSRPGGIVTKEQELEVRRAVTAALRAVRDPETHEVLVGDLLDASAGPGPHGIGGPNGGDLYLSLAKGTHLDSATSGALVEHTTPAGEHVVDPQHPEMQATFQLAGAGVAAGVDLGFIRQIDVAPTLCALLGLDPPAQSTGRILTRALARAPVAVTELRGPAPH